MCGVLVMTIQLFGERLLVKRAKVLATIAKGIVRNVKFTHSLTSEFQGKKENPGNNTDGCFRV